MRDPYSVPHEITLHTGPRGLILKARDWPGASSPPVVILHGFLEHGAAWDEVAGPLSESLGRRVIALDQRGHGRSGHVGSGGFYHFWDYVSDLDAVVEHLGGPIDLVGHSMGGTVASLYAGTRPERVRRLVLVEGLGPPDMSTTAVERARRFLADRRRGTPHRPLADIAEAVQRMRVYNPALSDQVATRLAEHATRPEGSGRTWAWDSLHRARSPVPFQASMFVQFLAHITAPTLSITGGASTFVLPDEAERLSYIRDRATAVVEGAGHLIHHDAPEALRTLLEDHLR